MNFSDKRASGVLLHVSSLPSKYGIGSFGKDAYRFVRLLKGAGQKFWQILPLSQTSFGDSPYQSFSTFAGNPYFIDLEQLIAEGYLTKADCDSLDFGGKNGRVEFGKLYSARQKIYKRIFERFVKNIPSDFDGFCADNDFWLDDYSLFMSIKDQKIGASLDVWELPLRKREQETLNTYRAALGDSILMYKMLQYLFFKQWFRLKAFTNSLGIKIIGDLPIYVSLDSADVWSNPELFDIDQNLVPKVVAGCPPDAFSKTGQLWGNPVYNWDNIARRGYSWWIMRLKKAFEMYDVVRIDHFRGFEAFYCIPFGDKTAQNGYWKKGPEMSLFEAAQKELGDMPIIAEDLGFLTKEVYDLLSKSGFPGMNVLQFAFSKDGESKYMPHRHIENSVTYTGTHDNNTLIGWLDDEDEENLSFAQKTLNVSCIKKLPQAMMKCALQSKARLSILTMQDILRLDGEARMNTPSLSSGNWSWRMRRSDLSLFKFKALKRCTKSSNR